MNSQNEVLKVNNLTIGYKGKKSLKNILLKDLELPVDKGDLICLLGPNGSGKSTLLRTIAGIQRPLKGNVLIDGKDIFTLDRKLLAQKLGVVLTGNADTANIPVNSIVSMGRFPYNNWLGMMRQEDLKKVDEVLNITGLEKYRNKNMSELSDGIRQKVMIARVLAQDTPVILLDEPTAFLDIPAKLEIMHMLRTLVRESEKSVILSTHDLEMALQSADKIWLITKDSIVSDTPEDLALNGYFERTFNTGDVEFLPGKGIFKMSYTGMLKLKVTGNELVVFWTEKALERIGITVTYENNYDGELIITANNHEKEWLLKLGNQERMFDSIAKLLAFLSRSPINNSQ
ncbi:MAG: ABC transporter ATP-binding protein [Bacteroidota bacterium]|nr:ABC transporter ATP-binding protein [Bacteroidota bacterium]